MELKRRRENGNVVRRMFLALLGDRGSQELEILRTLNLGRILVLHFADCVPNAANNLSESAENVF